MDSTTIKRLRVWFLANQRQLPWRENPSPYAVWVSEIMLQQTRVAVVIPYFMRWMERFPSIEALALASVEDVLKEWEGLGYYSRARNLHAGAQYVMKNFGGELPSTRDALMQIKGLGSYTVGAILSFAFKQRAAAVDGNVIRVLARYYAVEGDIARSETLKSLQRYAQELLPENDPWVISEALIELGATICGKKPRCGECPLKSTCRARDLGLAESLPKKAKQEKTIQLWRGVAVVESQGHLLLRKGERGQIMADLYEFPYFEISNDNFSARKCAEKLLAVWGVSAKRKRPLEVVHHTFTKYKATLIPHHLIVHTTMALPGYQWVKFADIKKLPFSAGHKKILAQLVV